MKTNSKRKVFGDAVDLLMGDMEEVTMPRGVQMVSVKSIQPFHDHPFHLYEGERLRSLGYKVFVLDAAGQIGGILDGIQTA